MPCDLKRYVWMVWIRIIECLTHVLVFLLQVEILELNLQELQQEFYNRQIAREQQKRPN